MAHYAKQPPNVKRKPSSWTEDELAPIGTRPEAEVALLTGHTYGTVMAPSTSPVTPARSTANDRNELPAQNWLRVRLTSAGGNRSAAGAKIRLTERSQPEKPPGFEQVTILDSQSAHSYYSLAPTERHFGLGRHGEVEVRVEFYLSGKIVKREVKANSTILISETE